MKSKKKTCSKRNAKARSSVARGSASFPTEFRGVMWNDHWEFDAPCVIYYPPAFMAFGIGGNTGHLDSMVEDICENLSLKWDHNDGGLDRECEWRGWSKRGQPFFPCNTGETRGVHDIWGIRAGKRFFLLEERTQK